MIQLLHKISNTKIVGNAKFIIIALLFVCALAYAFCTMRVFVYNNEYSHTLSFHSLKLDKSKEYLFVKEYKVPTSQTTVIVPMGRVNMPDSLCILYHNGEEWKLKLTDNLRKSHIDNAKETIFYPFCRLNEKKRDYSDEDFFHNSTKMPMQTDLLAGIRFNNASGRDAFVIKIEEQSGEYFLTKGVAFFTNRNVPISNKGQRIVELNFCINGDTLSGNKYVFSFPFFNSQNQPERKNIIFENGECNNFILDKDNSITINNCRFLLKSNYSNTAKNFVLPLLFSVLLCFSLLLLRQMYVLTNKTQHSRQRNLIKVEQFNILSLRVLFNCIILLGFPILLLKIQEAESRLYLITLLAVILNINWINAIKWLAKLIKSDSENFSKLSLAIIMVTTFATYFTSDELVFGKIPVLKITAIIFIFLPFAISPFSKLQLPSHEIFSKIKKYFSVKKKQILDGEEHSNKVEKDKSEQDFVFNMACYSALIILGGIILVLSKDFATLIFILLSLFLILIINFKRLKLFIKSATLREWSWVCVPIIVLGLIFWFFVTSPEKQYRFQSSLFFPDSEQFDNTPNIESSRQTIAGQIFLLNSVENDFNPHFNTVVLPETKSVFFSDYAVLWSFKIGGWLWFSLYLGVLLMLSYTIISLLVIFSKPIRLKTGKRGFYNKKIVFGLNILLSIMLVQYIYTFLTNFWTIPLTGQSPGLLSPVYFEYIFHIILINYLYVYLVSSVGNRQIAIMQDNYVNHSISPYVPAKFKALIIPIVFFAGSICLLFYQRCRINDRIQTNGNKMSWKIVQEYDLDSLVNLGKDSLLVLAHKSFDRMQNNAEEQRKFRNYLFAYYQSDNAKKKHYIDIDYIKTNTNIDSITSIKEVLDKESVVRGYSKYINGNPTLFVNNKYYGGCPPNAETVNFELQEILNKVLEEWAEQIDTKQGFKMVGGSIIIAENESGYIRASASYPLMYNENLYHILYKNNQINDVLQNYNAGAITENIKIKCDNLEYINFAEYDMMPGSVVKPFLAYYYLASGLPYSVNDLNALLGYSSNQIAEKLFRNLFEKNNYYNEADAVYKNDFGLTVYNNSFKRDKVYMSHAIGQQQKLIFKDIVQGYIRIKEGKNIKLSYKKSDISFENLSLNEIQLDILRNAMKVCLKNGTAKDVGKKTGTRDKGYLAKTGTAEILGDKTKNRTTAFIVVTEQYTIGIQLYGILPGDKTGLHAKDLFSQTVEILKTHNIMNFL
ncbi:hypothetical protein D0T84_04835 [Dysgonomonas sp. 521]|uniref:hypothetical protein n=1 Tax=Dysgonomonas sp. 521 TaxID=2302932 RepID=UPI0013D585B0|nr:hypothetical protein [Dysgonomonas sp. 521]NDV94245.1 hypothetical protein [Dysgonomonas sp. 521]